MKDTRRRKRIVVVMSCLLVGVGALTACGRTANKTSEAMQQLQALNYQEALDGFDAAEEAGEDQRLIARGRGIACMGMTDYEQAIANFRAALAGSDGFIEPIDFDLNYYLAAAYIKNGQIEEAEEAYNAILTLRPDEENAYFLRGNVRLERNDYEGAKEDFDKVVSMDPQNYDRLISIYEALSHYGYREAGQEYLNNALSEFGNKMGNYDIGRVYYYLGDYQQACLALEKARDKGDEMVSFYLGKAYEATGDYNYAASVYNSWIAKDDGSAVIYNQLGLCEIAKGNYQKALEAFQAGMQIEDNEVMQALSFNEIVVYEHLHEYRKASVLLDSYLRSYPDDETALREQVFLSTR